MTNAVSPTPASEWATLGDVVELPSGKTARLKARLSVWGLVRRGVFDQQHLEVFVRAQDGNLDATDDLKTVVAVQDVLLAEMFVEPGLFVPNGDGAQPGEGQVHIDDLDELDVQFVLERAMGVVRDAASFRAERAGVGGGNGGEVLGDDPEPAGRPAGGKPRRVAGGQKPRNQAGGKRAAGKR